MDSNKGAIAPVLHDAIGVMSMDSNKGAIAPVSQDFPSKNDAQAVADG